MIRFEAPQQRTACPVAKKAISENRESDQSVARLGNANFGLEAVEKEMIQFERREIEFRKKDREERAAELHLPVE